MDCIWRCNLVSNNSALIIIHHIIQGEYLKLSNTDSKALFIMKHKSIFQIYIAHSSTCFIAQHHSMKGCCLLQLFIGKYGGCAYHFSVISFEFEKGCGRHLSNMVKSIYSTELLQTSAQLYC